MKKVLFVFAIAAAFAACNNSGEGSTTTDSTTVKVDSTTTTVVDTTKMSADTTKVVTVDTTKKADTTKH